MDQTTLTPLSFDLRNDLSETPIDGNWTYLGTISVPEGEGNGNHDIYMHIERKVLGCVGRSNAVYLPHRLWAAHMSSSWVRAVMLHLANAGADALAVGAPHEGQASKGG